MLGHPALLAVLACRRTVPWWDTSPCQALSGPWRGVDGRSRGKTRVRADLPDARPVAEGRGRMSRGPVAVGRLAHGSETGRNPSPAETDLQSCVARPIHTVPALTNIETSPTTLSRVGSTSNRPSRSQPRPRSSSAELNLGRGQAPRRLGKARLDEARLDLGQARSGPRRGALCTPRQHRLCSQENTYFHTGHTRHRTTHRSCINRKGNRLVDRQLTSSPRPTSCRTFACWPPCPSSRWPSSRWSLRPRPRPSLRRNLRPSLASRRPRCRR